MKKPSIQKGLSNQVLMIGVYYKNSAPGGMAAVIQYYARYFETLRYIPTWKDENPFIRLAYFLSALIRVFIILLCDKQIKILHIHSAADGSFWRKSLFLNLGKLFNKRVVFHIHASRFKDFYAKSNKKEKILTNLNKADYVLVLSESWRSWFKGIGVDVEKIRVLANITDYPKLQEDKATPTSKLNLLFLGEIGDRKGIFNLLNAIAKNKKLLSDKIELRIGGNKNESKLLSCIADLGVQDFVYFEGWVSGDRKTELLNWADIYVLPSYHEGLPIGILEAMSYGCAIISTPVGGIPEVVESGVNGRLVTPGDEKEIAESIRIYVQVKQLAAEHGIASSKKITQYLPESVLLALHDLYSELLLRQLPSTPIMGDPMNG